MKRLLNAALSTALLLSTVACTVVTDPSSASSSPSGSESTSFLDRQQQIAAFASRNLEPLRNDMATGQGEYLGSLAALMGIEASRQPAFFALTRQKFAVLFPSDQTTAAEMLTALDRELRADPQFSPALAQR